MCQPTSPVFTLTALERKVDPHGNEQRAAEHTRTPLVVELGRPPRADGLAPVQVDDDRVAERQDGQQREDAGDDERRARGLRAEVEQRDGNRADVNRVFELVAPRQQGLLTSDASANLPSLGRSSRPQSTL